LRGSRDGFDAKTFHRLCDGNNSMLTVIKNTNGFIFGGYTSIPWSSGVAGYRKDSTAFLFSLTNLSNTQLKLRVNILEEGVWHRSDYGPIFGHDALVVSDLSTNRYNWMDLRSYELPNGKIRIEGGKFIVEGSDNKFQAVEIEVFHNLFLR